jgi:hypothetical protein
LSRRVVYGAIAALSGFSALVFENLWFRSSALTLGSGVWSSALVLSAFMAGIAVGNALAIRFETKVDRPLRAYAAVEFDRRYGPGGAGCNGDPVCSGLS